MGNGGTKENQNVYFRARKQAAMYNERLSSREGAAEMLGISPSTLADYELGITKFVPVDKVVLMADLYNCPELRTGYCKYECPIGKHIPLATSVSGIEGIALRLMIFKDEEVYKFHKYQPCYSPELSDSVYTGNDFLELCNCQQDLADELFEGVDWQHPESLKEDWFVNGEWVECEGCGKIINYGDGCNDTKCPNCGRKVKVG